MNVAINNFTLWDFVTYSTSLFKIRVQSCTVSVLVEGVRAYMDKLFYVVGIPCTCAIYYIAGVGAVLEVSFLAICRRRGMGEVP